MKSFSTRLALVCAGAGSILTLVGCGGAAPDTASATPSESSAVSSSPDAGFGSPTRSPAGTPRGLEIEAIGVDAPIIEVGTEADGSQEVPTSVHEVGWWAPGTEPGASGTGVLVGHTYSLGEGVFDDLDALRVGDTIRVVASDGVAEFAVERVKSVPVEEFGAMAADIYRIAGEPRLVLMTCGDFDGSDYRATVIVYARLVLLRA
ncbi:class F sortase [Nocardioides sp. AE5]|uniref:class F sortase n=1 Tax=Nocardioides sp. AE5 TaxID=2962573 RepID=UPI002882A1C8|nr:class F sortase [Nocardioides sp. AE5]MDT0200487.1 class F sortase [Nocardioides sp. AE5]